MSTITVTGGIKLLEGSITAAFIPATVSFQTSTINNADLTIYTFSSQAIGTAEADRKVVVGVSGHGSTASARSISSMTIGGVSATLLVASVNSAESQYITELWQAPVPTGSTGDVVITFNATMGYVGIGSYAVTGATLSAHATALDTVGDPLSTTIDVPAGGVLIGACGDNAAGFIWTGITEKYDEILGAGEAHSGASDAFATIQTGLAVTCLGSGARERFALASFGPA